MVHPMQAFIAICSLGSITDPCAQLNIQCMVIWSAAVGYLVYFQGGADNG